MSSKAPASSKIPAESFRLIDGDKDTLYIKASVDPKEAEVMIFEMPAAVTIDKNGEAQAAMVACTGIELPRVYEYIGRVLEKWKQNRKEAGK